MSFFSNSNKDLSELTKINESLNSINIIEPKYINKKNNIYERKLENNFIQTNSSLNEIYNINILEII